MTYDFRGNLTPYTVIEMDFDNFQKHFVKAFPDSTTRLFIFGEYERYLSAFRELITEDFLQWIDGSFVSQKQNPRDIDIVTWIDFEIYQSKKELISKHFIGNAISFNFKVDNYILQNYPKNHEEYAYSMAQKAYWKDFFGHTRPNRAGNKLETGFVEIKFEKNGK